MISDNFKKKTLYILCVRFFFFYVLYVIYKCGRLQEATIFKKKRMLQRGDMQYPFLKILIFRLKKY